jgi:hypothetical protein
MHTHTSILICTSALSSPAASSRSLLLYVCMYVCDVCIHAYRRVCVCYAYMDKMLMDGAGA